MNNSIFPRYLTKSKFQLATECPTKLFYTGKEDYSNLKTEDAFLQALAESGFQVAELAKAYYPEGILIETLDYEEALAETAKLLEREKVVIFEGAFRHETFFIRTDILIKDNDHLTLIEVKSKSFGENDKTPFFTAKNPKAIHGDWKSYVFDVAYQKFVLSKCFHSIRISSYLMVVDKTSLCPSEGLNQKFRITKDEKNRVKIVVSDKLTREEISQQILRKINIDDEINFIFYEMKFRDFNFSEYMNYLSKHYSEDIKIPPILGSICKTCEFKLDPKSPNPSLKSGFNECWSAVCSLKEDEPTVLEVWDFRDADKLIKQGIYRIKQLTEENVKPRSDEKPGLSRTERQWKQVEKIINDDNEPYLDIENLRSEMNSWTYPLHFIDFETAMPAIPFNKNERPFQGLAFQFSHHILYEDGLVEHAGQYINDKVGQNPTLDFIRALKADLENCSGTIFRYSNHENTFLNMIYIHILSSSDSIPDRVELISFIEKIAQPTDKNKGKWKEGPRNMVDLWELVKRYYYDPITRGSNSIKKVFPAILQRSHFLSEKYGKLIYGSENGIKSLNISNRQWIQINEDNKIIDPYDLLPKLFKDVDISEDGIELLFHDNKLKEGGSASIAYARMQFTEMSEMERGELKKALLEYCELDTLAMVMIVEAWKKWSLADTVK
jgi:hypothetical protein